MKTKLFQLIFFIIFFILFSYFFAGEYIEFHKEKITFSKNKEILNKNIQNFGFNTIDQIDNIELEYTPNNKTLDKIIQKINKAEKNIYIEMYMFTEKKLIKAITQAHKRNIDIKMILEKNPYKAFNINNKTFNTFEKLGINVVWSNSQKYTLNHSKLIIIDNEVIIGTGNFTHSTFTTNKDFFIFIKNKKIKKQVTDLFLGEYLGKTNYKYYNNLALSPIDSRLKIEKLIKNAQNKISIYIPYIIDKNITNLLQKKANQGIEVMIITDKNWYDDNNEIISSLKNNKIKIKKLSNNKLHAKMIIIDKKILILGSINFSRNSFDENREISIITKNEKIINDLILLFNNDFDKKNLK